MILLFTVGSVLCIFIICECILCLVTPMFVTVGSDTHSWSDWVFTLHCWGGLGRDKGHAGENGTVSGKACPKGLYGIFCEVVYLVLDIVILSVFS